MIFCRMLGEIQVEVDGVPVELGGRVARRALAALLVADGAPVADDRLIDQVWGADQPANGINALRVVVSRLRTALGPTGQQLLERAKSGYALRISAEFTDRGRFIVEIERGLRQLADGDMAAGATLDGALALWRGRPWEDLGDQPELSGPRSRLTELYEIGVEESQAARLAAGDSASAVSALSEAVTAAPYRERRWELLALALYRSGRQTHALAELRRVRELLMDELGVEPGPALRLLEQRMLSHDPGLLLSESPTAPTLSATAPPDLPGRSVVRPLSTLIGREHDLELLGELTGRVRLLTLVGPAGVGKTRLAIEHAVRTGATVWFVRLADVRTAHTVANAVAETIGLVDTDEKPLVLLQRALADRAGLLVLDNCEHLVDAIATLVMALLHSCHRLRILTTSRMPLGVDGEHTMPVSPLPVLAAQGSDGPAVALLVDRVRTNRAGWEPTPPELVAAREICVLLDGLPLAIELAAARERAFGLGDIAVHLRRRLDVLGTAPRGSISPHAGLDAAIGWSIDLLTPADRALLQRMWPFEGGFTWVGAAAMQPPEQPAASVLAVLAGLVERSVIVADTSMRPTRYRMLETIRRYCQRTDPDPAATEAAHARWVRELVAELATMVTGIQAGYVTRTASAELANIRAGIEYDIEHDPVAALHSAGSLEWVWVAVGALSEGVRLTNNALAACADAPVEVRARGLVTMSIMSHFAGRSADALRYADLAIDLLGDRPTGKRGELLLIALVNRGAGAGELGDVRLSRQNVAWFQRESERLPVSPWVRALSMIAESGTLLMERKRADGEAMLHAAREFGRECGFIWVQGTADVMLARSMLRGRAVDKERAGEAVCAIQRACWVFHEHANVFDSLTILYTGAHALAAVGLHDAAVVLQAGVLEQAAQVGADPRQLPRLAGKEVEQRMKDLLTEPDRRRAEQLGRTMDPAALYALFTRSAAPFCPPPSDGQRQ